MYEIEMHDISKEFERCWVAAFEHIDRQAQGPLPWLKASLHPPFLEHLSFRLGNQLFFVRVEDADGRVKAPGTRYGLRYIAKECGGRACILQLRERSGEWAPVVPGWGFVDARGGRRIEPPELVTDEKIEMTAWEIQDFAVQIVRADLAEKGRQLMSWQANPEVDPSVWFVGDHGPEWIAVGAFKRPHAQMAPPKNASEIAATCAKMSRVGWFAAVSIGCCDDDPGREPGDTRLWRGYCLDFEFDGLEPLAR